MTDVELRLTADVDGATKGVNAFRKEFQGLVKEVEKPLRQVDALRQTQESAKAASTAYFEARRRVDELKRAIEQAGQPVRGLNREYQQAQRTLAGATREFERQKTQVREQRAELRAAGVDTRNLASEQQRLQAELARRMRSGREDAAQQAALDRLGVSRVRELRGQVVSLRADYDRLQASAKLSTTERIVLEQRYRQQLAATRAELRAMGGEQGAAGGGAGIAGIAGLAGRAAGGLALAYTAQRALTAYTSATDRVGEMNDRLLNAVGSQDELNEATARLRDISSRTYTDVANNAELFIGSLQPLKELGFTTEDVLGLTEALGLGLVASATKGERAAAIVNQFNKAMQVGVLRGEEFNSVIQGAPELANALARGLGVTRQELIALAAAGELTSEKVIPALISQLPELGKKVDDMRVTVGDGALKISTAFDLLISNFDNYIGLSDALAKSLSSLADSITDLADGNIAEGVGEVFGELFSWSLYGQLSKWTGLSDAVGNAFKSLVGSAEEVVAAQDKLQLQLSLDENESRDRNIRRLADEQLALAKQKGLKADEVEVLRAWAQQMGTTYEDFIAREKERQGLREAGERGHQARMKEVRASALADLQKNIDAQQKALEAARDKLKSAKDEELAIEQEFNQLVADIRSGGRRGGETFADAQQAKINARQALQGGDTKTAIEQARQAGEILKSLQAAGENTYGFAGIAQELADIANSAAKINSENVDAEVKGLEEQLNLLQKQAEALKVVSVDFEWDEANAEQIKARMQQLAAELAKVMIIKPTVVAPDGAAVVAPADQIPALAGGGKLRGPGTGTSDSILMWGSNGEFMQPEASVRYYGEDFMELIRQRRFPKYATGGLIGESRALPSIPPLAPALQQQLESPSGLELGDWGRATLDSGGDSIEVLMKRDSFDRLLQRTAAKLARTHRS